MNRHFLCCVLFIASCAANVFGNEIRTIEFSNYKGNQARTERLEGQNGWKIPGDAESPRVGETERNGKSIKTVRTVPDPEFRSETPKVCIAFLPVDSRLPAETRIIVVEADLMVDGLSAGQVAMVGFGKSTPVQFGIDLGGFIAIRTDQWGKPRLAVDASGKKIQPEYGVWYRFRLEIDPHAEDGKGTGRLFVRNLTGDDIRIPENGELALRFDVEGKTTSDVPLETKFPFSQWNTFWLRTSNAGKSVEGGFISRIALSTADEPTPVHPAALAPEKLPKPVRGAEETETLLRLNASDVLLSSRWKHPGNAKDSRDTMKAIADYHANRNEWCYCDEIEFVQKVKSKVKSFGGSVNTLYKVGKSDGDKALPGQAMTRDGKPVVAPWMVSFKGYWGCVNSKEYREDYLARIDRLVRAGADTLHMDDPGLNEATVSWGGCFCPDCIDGFRQYLKDKPLPEPVRKKIGDPDRFDVRSVGPDFPILWTHFKDFQHESVRKFYVDMRRQAREKSGKELLLSMNNYNGNWQFPTEFADYGIAELPEKGANPANLFQAVEKARQRGKIQIFTLSFRDVLLNRQSFAMLYAGGSHAILPWDVYITTESPRLFIEPEDYADLSGFVRAMVPRLDGHATGPACGGGLESSPGKAMQIRGTKTLCGLARKPKNGTAAVHLVEWGKPEKSELTLDVDALWNGNRSKEIRLYTPTPYDPLLHAEAEKSGRYTPLAQSQPLAVRYASDGKAVIDLPPIPLWGILCFPIEQAEPSVSTSFPYNIVYTGESSKKIERYAPDGRIVWDFPAELARDVSVLPNGNILFCFNENYDSKKHDNVSGAIEVTPEKKIVFEFKTTGQVFSCRRKPNGETVVGAASQGKLLVVDSKGKLQKEIALKNQPGHSCMRHVRLCRNGDYLVAEESAKKVRRYDPDGNPVREISVPYPPFCPLEMENGNIVISGKTGILEIDPNDNIVWEFKGSDFPEIGLRWCAGLELLKNGNLLAVNAGGTARIFEIARTPKPTIVWQLDPNRVKVPAGHAAARIAD